MKYFIKTENLASRVIEGQAFIINTKTSMLHELDATGTFIWNLIEKKKNRLDTHPGGFHNYLPATILERTLS